MRAPILKPDLKYAGMWRLQFPDGQLSDMVSVTWAKDAAAVYLETMGRRQRARQSPPEARPMRSGARAAR
jgi:hypothetical protein